MTDAIEQNADTVGAERLATMIHTVMTALRLATEARARSAEDRARMVRAGQLSPAPAGGGEPVGVAELRRTDPHRDHGGRLDERFVAATMTSPDVMLYDDAVALRGMADAFGYELRITDGGYEAVRYGAAETAEVVPAATTDEALAQLRAWEGGQRPAPHPFEFPPAYPLTPTFGEAAGRPGEVSVHLDTAGTVHLRGEDLNGQTMDLGVQPGGRGLRPVRRWAPGDLDQIAEIPGMAALRGGDPHHDHGGRIDHLFRAATGTDTTTIHVNDAGAVALRGVDSSGIGYQLTMRGPDPRVALGRPEYQVTRFGVGPAEELRTFSGSDALMQLGKWAQGPAGSSEGTWEFPAAERMDEMFVAGTGAGEISVHLDQKGAVYLRGQGMDGRGYEMGVERQGYGVRVKPLRTWQLAEAGGQDASTPDATAGATQAIQVWNQAGLKGAAAQALATASDPQDYLARLAAAGVDVTPRYSTHTPGMITGYSLAGVDSAGQPRAFTGSELGLSWQQVTQQLANIADPTTPDATQTITRGRKQA